ncbi:MAG: putative glycolipid-binding domain-containing protein [Rhizobiaceae bacterium]|nr:putative glycolipid-binding domain-containing protein [Rhizobiaceae bacterium]
MSFSEQFIQSYRWRLEAGTGGNDGLEHLHINSCDNNIIASSTVIGDRGGLSYGIKYTIICSPDWVVRSFKIEKTDGNSLAMNSDGEGNWFNEDGSSASRFKGIIDIDLSGTPFTNTMPIRRLQSHTPGKSQRFKMLYIPFDTLDPKIDKQQYTCIKPFKKYRYEALGRQFTADLKVDENAIVLDYPALFKRLELTS